jgi:hypothetical protein
MSTVEAPREQELITGTLSGIVQKGPDKWQAVVLPDGSQYNKNLWTKDEKVLPYLQSQIGNRISILCNASHWVRNDGQPVRSLWIEQVGSPTAAPPQQPQGAAPAQAQASYPPPQQPQQQSAVVQPQVQQMVAQAPQPVTQGQKEERIMREAASKVAAMMLAYVKPEDQNMSSLLVMSERLVAYYANGLPAAETLDDLMTRAMPSSIDAVLPGDPVMDPPTHEPYPGDDDIPF